MTAGGQVLVCTKAMRCWAAMNTMQTTTFGRLGRTVSVAGLGCGGRSRLGTRHSEDRSQAIAVVRAAIDAGVGMIDTARSYGTEGGWRRAEGLFVSPASKRACGYQDLADP